MQAQQPGEGTLEDSLLLHVLVLGFVVSLGPCVWYKSAPAIYISLTLDIKFAPFLFIKRIIRSAAHVLEIKALIAKYTCSDLGKELNLTDFDALTS